MRGFVLIGRKAALQVGMLVGLALAGGLLAPSAAGARGLKTGFIDGLFASPDSSQRARWIGHAKADGASLIRISVRWREVVGSKPRSPSNPADPAYHFGSIDGAVQSARAKRLNVMLTVYAAPDWAEGKHRPSGVPVGSWKPKPKAFGHFAQALAKRYSGHYHGLPRVRYFEAWNEPNLTNYLAPQWRGKKSKSPGLYRSLLNRFYQGVKKSQQHAKVIGGATAPFGDDRGHPVIKGSPRMRPLAFLRKLFCLHPNLKPAKCKTKPHLDILSHHPVNILNSPHYSAKDRDDVEVADFRNVRRVLHAATHAKHVRPKGNHPLWATEIWWLTDPPNRIGISVKKQARWLEEALYMLWKQGASAVVNYEIRDQDYDPRQSPRTQVNSGVFFKNGKKKPAYRTFRFPFVTHRISKKRVGVWGKAPSSGRLKIQRKRHKHWHTLKRVKVHRGHLFKPKVRVRGHAKLRAVIGKTHSLPWSAGGGHHHHRSALEALSGARSSRVREQDQCTRIWPQASGCTLTLGMDGTR